MTDNIIRGSIFGLFGGGGPKKPKITPDNLNSRQQIRVLDLLSEGEIEGFASPSKEGLTQGTSAYNNACLKDVFLSNTPVLESTADSSDPSASDFNFDNVGFDVRFGTSNQTKIKGVRATGSPISVGVDVTKSLANGVTRQITDSTVDQVRVILDFPQLQKFTTKGDQLGSKVELKIKVQYNNGGFTTVKTDTVKGRTTDLYQRSYLINLDGDFPVDIRVTRETADSTSTNTVNTFRWNSYIELKDDNLKYPDSAYTSLKLDSKQFSSVPQRTFRIRGIKVRIPSSQGASSISGSYNQSGFRVTVDSTSHGFVAGDSFVFTPNAGATPTGTYTVIANTVTADQFQFDVSVSQTVAGSPTCTLAAFCSVDNTTGRINYPSNYVFDGTMGSAVFTTCPAMILLDLMTNKRYGFGTHLAPDQSTDAKLYENIDLFSFFNASRFANQLVDDGRGGEEARFACSVSIQSSSEAFKLINELAGVMRCMPIWSAGSISLAQDKPKDPSYLFNLSNVTEAGFSYSGSDLKTRSTIINVSYLNMETREIDYETVGDDVTGDNPNQDDIDRQAKYGIVVKNIKAFACTSPSQARRLARAVLFSQERESETVTFSTSIDTGVIVRPSSIIEIVDPVRSGLRRGGKVKSATTSEITIDDITSVNLQTSTLGSNPKLSVILPDGTMETKAVSTLEGAVFTVSGTYSQTPNANTVWLFQNDDEQSQLFRVISVSESDGAVYNITALSYVSNKYAAIEVDETIEDRSITILNNPVDPPTNLKAVEKIVAINNKAVSKIIITWEAVSGVNEYQVNYRLDDNNFTSVRVLSNDFEIFNSSAGTYEIEVFAYNTLGDISSTATTLEITTQGKTAPPSDITGLSLEPINDKDVRLRWDLHPDVDVIHGGQIYVRHNTIADGTATFQNSTNLVPALAGNSTLAVVPAIEGEYILKARDDSGNFSTGETSVVLDIPEEIEPLAVLTRREDLDNPIFQGTKSDTVEVSEDLSSIDLKSTGLFDDIPDFDALASLDDFGAISPEGTYDFGGTAGGTALDLGAVYNLELKRHIFAEGFIPNNLFDFITDVDLMTDFDGVEAFDSSADLLVKTSGNASTYSPSGTYTQSGGTEVTIDISNHNFKVGSFVSCDFTTGTATDGEFEITSIVNANQFKVKVTNAVSTSGNVTCGADYTPFQSFANGRFKGQSFKFRAKLNSNNVNQDIKVTQLGYTASFPRRTEQSTSNIDAGSTGTKTITFDNEFFTGTSALGGVNSSLPSIGITAQNMLSGEFFEISSITGAGFTVAFKTSTGAAATPSNRSGTTDTIKFGFTAVGFGKKG